MDLSANFLSGFCFWRARRTGFWALAIALATVVGTAIPRQAAAQFQDVGYTFEPTVQGIFEDDAAVFENDPLYGGALGLNFGRHFQVSAEYLVNTGMTAHLSNLDRFRGLLDRDLDLRRYGARVRFNLYDRRVIPYLTAGTGILQFDPANAELSRTIYGLAGGGITFSVYDRYRLSVGAEYFSYRYDPVATFLGPTGADAFESGTQLVTAPALTASVSLFLGGRSLEEQTIVDAAIRDQFGGRGFLRGVQLLVNPFYGRVEFNPALGFPKDQNMTGINAGLSLGPYVGLRGFYWRGARGSDVTDEFGGGFEDIQMYGSELQLRLNLTLGQGFVPYARFGGGYLDVMGGYQGDIPTGTEPPEDRFFGTTGLGLEVPLTRAVKLSGGARALLTSNPNAAEPGSPGDIYGSLMYTTGIEFRLGGRDRPRPDIGPEPTPLFSPEEGPAPAATSAERADTARAPGRAPLTSRERRLLARADSLERVLQAIEAEESRRVARVSVPPESNLSGRTMTVPVPEMGELYIRFGDLGTTTVTSDRLPAERQAADAADDLETRLRSALREELQSTVRADTARALTSGDVERLVQRTLRETIEEREAASASTDEGPSEAERARMRQIEELRSQVEALQQQLRERPATVERVEPVRVDATTDQPFYRQTFGRPLTFLVPISGFRAGEGPNQFQIGIRGDYRRTPSARFHLLPELSFGLGGGEKVSPTILVGAAYSFLRTRFPELVTVPLEPYVGAGFGLASDGGFTFEPVTHVMTGVTYRFAGGEAFFVEYGMLDFFNTHRVHVGARIPM